MGKMKKRIVMVLAVILIITGIQSYESNAAAPLHLSGAAHVQTYSDMTGKIINENGTDTLVLGTRGQGKRVEQITINLENNTNYKGSIEYRVHRQTYGWTDWVKNGNPAGTTGEGKRLEAIEIRLTGELAEHYDVRYSAHAQSYGDAQGWVYNGALAGTTGEAKRLEEIKVQIIPKGMISQEQVSYRVHRQTYGWEPAWAYDGKISGTTGQAKRLEGITIDIKGNMYDGGITYRTHVQSYGWLDWVSNGTMSGTQGESKRLEAIEIKLTGEMEKQYDIYYRVHAQSFGWMGWVKNGSPAGTSGYGYRLEAIQVVLVKKGSAAPAASYDGATQDSSNGYSDKEDAAEQVPAPPAEEKAVWHEPKYQTVKIFKCSDCKRVFKNKTDIENHFIEYTDDNCDGDYTETDERYLIQDGYYEYSQPGKTFVPAEFQMQWITDEEEYIEENVPVYEMREFAMCLQCKERFYGEDGNVSSRLTEHLKYRKDCWSYTVTSELEQVGTRDVVHPELGHWSKVMIKSGYSK